MIFGAALCIIWLMNAATVVYGTAREAEGNPEETQKRLQEKGKIEDNTLSGFLEALTIASSPITDKVFFLTEITYILAQGTTGGEMRIEVKMK